MARKCPLPFDEWPSIVQNHVFDRACSSCPYDSGYHWECPHIDPFTCDHALDWANFAERNYIVYQARYPAAFKKRLKKYREKLKRELEELE